MSHSYLGFSRFGWIFKHVSMTSVHDPQVSWKDDSVVNILSPEFLLDPVVMSLLFVNLSQQIKEHHHMVFVEDFSLSPGRVLDHKFFFEVEKLH